MTKIKDKVFGLSEENYLWTLEDLGDDPEHPVRRYVLEKLGDFTELKVKGDITYFKGVYGERQDFKLFE